jgi:ATP-binding cassette subfamily F protein uup
MQLITLEGVDKSYPETAVLDGVSMSISSGQRIGLIGQNGSGKSTLIGIIDGSIEPDAGNLVQTSNLRVASLDQNPEFPPQATIGDVVSFSRQAIALVDRLGLTDPEQLASTLSGGQRKRLALAVALSIECDLLILDEPTNHLDVDTIDWLEDHLATITSSLLLVTHDRYLLDRVVDTIVEVYERKVYPQPGSYAKYLEARAIRDSIEAADANRRRQRIKTELAWLSKRPKARTTKARYRVNQAEELIATGVPDPRPELVMTFPTRRIGSKIVNLHNVGKSFDGRVVLKGVEYLLAPDARIGIVGPNGSGKTTLLSMIAQRLEPDTGKVAMGSTVVPGWYGQDPTSVSPETRVIDMVSERAEHVRLDHQRTATASKLLEMFQFPRSKQRAAVGDLSGGERRRLELLLVLMESPNLLLLDEPTNDLDLDTLHALEDYLDGWEGAMVVASHDRYFLDRVCHDIFSIEADGSVRHHPGGWTAYWALHRPQSGGGVAQERSSIGGRASQQRTKLTYRDKRELDGLTVRIDKLTADRKRLESELSAAGSDVDRVTRLGNELAMTLQELTTSEARWLELSELAESLASQRPES